MKKKHKQPDKEKTLSDEFFYWNTIPSLIPLVIDGLDVSEENSLIEKWEDSVWTSNVKTRHQRLKNIKDIPPIHKISIDRWVMDRLKEACDLYTRGFFIASISLCGILSEFIIFKMIEEWIKENGIEDIIGWSGLLKDHRGRIKILKNLDKISQDDSDLLNKIRKIRNDYIHSNIIERRGNRTKEDNKIVIKDLIEFLNSNF